MNYKEYEICERRGHTASPIAMSVGNTTKYTCKFCGTEYYYTEPQLVEDKIPTKKDNDSNITFANPV